MKWVGQEMKWVGQYEWCAEMLSELMCLFFVGPSLAGGIVLLCDLNEYERVTDRFQVGSHCRVTLDHMTVTIMSH